jgi:predicted hotdog family 3-hydroxylacyl-ACP dehydratase
VDLPWLVEELLPHSRSMVLIDDAIEAGADWVLAGVRIGEDSPFYDPELGGVPSWVGIEYMAQTVALFSGIQTKRAAREIKVGLLVGVRRYQAETVRFPLGAYLRIRATKEWDDRQMAVFNCELGSDQPLAAGRLNVYQPEDPQALISGKHA